MILLRYRNRNKTSLNTLLPFFIHHDMQILFKNYGKFALVTVLITSFSPQIFQHQPNIRLKTVNTLIEFLLEVVNVLTEFLVEVINVLT